MSKIEVFTGSCHLCDEAVQLVSKAAEGTNAEVVVRSIDGPEAKAYGLRSVPSIVKDGEVAYTRVPTPEEAAELVA